MTRTYNEYLAVDTDFIPVFSAFSDRDNPTKWKSFFPHESFITILNQLADTLEMGSNEKNQSLWLYGAYGTGKTFASFVIKHLLEDELPKIREYYEINKLMPLYTKFAGIRSRGKTLVVHRSSSAGIASQDRLFNCIVESVKSTLRAKGLTYMGEKSQLEIILETLKDPNSPFNFQNIFTRNRPKFEGYSTVSSIIADLENLPIEDSAGLLETIVNIAEENNFVFKKSVDDIIDWLDDVRKGNELYAIVFIWDEFTEFFKNNQNNLTCLQEIAHASPTIRFYFLLITHSGPEIIHDQAARKVIEARFKTRPVEMADTTAFMLMGQAIKVNSELREEWEMNQEDLWAKVRSSTTRTLINRAPEIQEKELRKLLPIHPYSAYLLKIISKDISSNQRTMFQFLSGEWGREEEPKINFRWFIERHSNEIHQWNYLTVDHLWEYFFTEDNVDLSVEFKTAMAQFNNYLPLCQGDKDQERILRVALLLSSMQQKSGGARNQGQSGLLRPTLENIAYAFSATPIESKVQLTMAGFTQKQIFGKVEENGEVLYVPPAGKINQERWETLRKEVLIQIPFEKIINDTNYAVFDQFKPDSYLTNRYQMFLITPKDFQNAERTAPGLKSSKIPLFFITAKDETERTRVKPTIEKILRDSPRKMVIVDFSGQVLTEKEYERFIDEKTNERYYTGDLNYIPQLNLAKANAKRIIEEWKQKINFTTLNIYKQSIENPTQIMGGSNFRKQLREINQSWFSAGLEALTQNEKLFSQTGYTEEFAQMAMDRKAVPANYGYVRDFIYRLRSENIWNDLNYWKNQPNHIISQMKAKIEDVIRDAFEKQRKVAFTDIWQALEQPPFGLFTCQGAVFVLGFLLKEYADNSYYKDDGANTVPLNYTDLSSLIFAVTKELPRANNQFIVRQTPEQIEFCKITGEIFKLAQNKRNSVDDVGKNISIFLSDNRFPLWSLKSLVEKQEYDYKKKQDILTAIDLFCEFASTNQIIDRDRMSIQADLYNLYKKDATLAPILGIIVTVENMRAGMEAYVETYKPEIIKVIQRLQIGKQELISALLERLSPDSSYLWQVGDTNQQIDSLYIDYKFIDSINVLLTEKKHTFEDARKALDQKMGKIKVPELLILNENPQLKTILLVIKAIRSNEVKDKASCIKIIDDQAENFINFFNNQYKIFGNAIQNEIKSTLRNDEIEDLFNNVEPNAYFADVDRFIQQMSNRLNEYRKNKKINQLKSAWKERTNTQTPAEWSSKHLLPIICLFKEENNNALLTFNFINQSTKINVDEEIIDQAIEFVNSDALDILDDLHKSQERFIEFFGSEYAYVIDNVEDLQRTIANEVTGEVDNWMNVNRIAVDKCIERFAKHRYETFYRQKVKEKIQSLSPEKAQKYLNELVWDKPLVGISILKEQE